MEESFFCIEDNLKKELSYLSTLADSDFFDDANNSDKSYSDIVKTKINDCEFLVQQYHFEAINNSNNSKATSKNYQSQFSKIKSNLLKKISPSLSLNTNSNYDDNNNDLIAANKRLSSTVNNAKEINSKLIADKEKLENIYIKGETLQNNLGFSTYLVSQITKKQQKHKKIFFISIIICVTVIIFFILNKLFLN